MDGYGHGACANRGAGVVGRVGEARVVDLQMRHDGVGLVGPFRVCYLAALVHVVVDHALVPVPEYEWQLIGRLRYDAGQVYRCAHFDRQVGRAHYVHLRLCVTTVRFVVVDS